MGIPTLEGVQWESQPLGRYILKNKDTGDVLFVVVFTLLSKDKVDEEEVKRAETAQKPGHGTSQETGQKTASQRQNNIETADDVVD